MGEFQSCIINIYEAKPDGTEKNKKPWALVDQASTEAAKMLRPNSAFQLTKPGADVTIISPAGKMTDAVVLKSGKTYIALFAISGSEKNDTHKVRFTVE